MSLLVGISKVVFASKSTTTMITPTYFFSIIILNRVQFLYFLLTRMIKFDSVYLYIVKVYRRFRPQKLRDSRHLSYSLQGKQAQKPKSLSIIALP